MCTLWNVPFLKVRIKLLYALRTNTMTEVRFGMPDEIVLDRMPVALIVFDTLAV
jgi:hypothetical protein